MQERRWVWALVVPTVVVVGCILVPALRTVVLGASRLTWVADAQLSTVVNTSIWVVGGVLGTTTLALIIAALMPRGRAETLLSTLLLVPSGITLAVAAVAWRASFAFRPAAREQVGVVNEVVTTAGLSPISWLTQEPLVNTVVLVAALVWVATGVAAVVLAGAIRAVPQPAIDGARAAGASELAIFRRIVLPAIRVPLGGVALVVAIVALRAHDLVRVATGGRFGTAILATESIDRSLVEGQAGRGAALALVVCLVLLPAAALLAWRAVRRTPSSLAEQVAAHTDHAAIRPPGRHSARRREAAAAQAQRPRGAWLRTAVVALVALAWSVPVVALGVIALRPAASADTGWWRVISERRIGLDNLRSVLDAGMWAGFGDSVLIAVPATALTVGLAHLLVWALARGPRPLSAVARVVLVVAAVLPLTAVLPSLVDIAGSVGLDGTLPGVWLAHLALTLPLAALLLGRAMRGSDGDTEGGRALTGATAGVASAVFLLVWNDLLVAAAIRGQSGAGPSPLPLRLAELVAVEGERLPLVAAGAVVTALVPVVVLVSMRRQLVDLVVGRPRGTLDLDGDVVQRPVDTA